MVKIIAKILSDGQLIYSKVNKLDGQTDSIKESEMLKKLEKVKDMVEELSQMELVDTKHDVETPKIVSVFSASTPGSSTRSPMTPIVSSFVFNEFDELSEIDNLFDQLELDDEYCNLFCFSDSVDTGTAADDDDNEELEEWTCSIRDICDYDSDTGICEY